MSWVNFLYLALHGLGPAFAEPPMPVPLDVSRPNQIANAAVIIKQHRIYSIAVNFYYIDDKDRVRISHLIGSGERDASGNLSDTGISVPIHLTIKTKSGELIYDKTTNTRAMDFRGFTDVRGTAQPHAGYFARVVANVPLRPGAYEIEGKTSQGAEQFSGTVCALSIATMGNTLPLS